MEEITEPDTLRALIKAKPLVVLDMYIPSCGPCAMLTPMLEDIGVIAPGVCFVKANMTVDALQDIKLSLGVMRYPTIGYFVGGKIAEITVGADMETILATIVKWYNTVYSMP
jgi:thioredoxin-like negative regulator of GroEL